MAIYLIFGQFCVFAWGSTIEPLITDKLPHDFVGNSIRILFSINVLFSYPIVIYPAHMVVESILYKGWEKSKKRQMSKNVTRTALVGFTVIVTILLGKKLDQFLSIIGSLFCTPIAFTFPAMFHYKACAET